MTDAVLVDTDVFSFIFKDDTRADLYRADLIGRRTALSFMNVAELQLWAIRHKWGATQRAPLRAATARCAILLPDDRTVAAWAEITADRARLGQPISCGDAWIAATALRRGLPIVTHNARDFGSITGLTVISHP